MAEEGGGGWGWWRLTWPRPVAAPLGGRLSRVSASPPLPFDPRLQHKQQQHSVYASSDNPTQLC